MKAISDKVKIVVVGVPRARPTLAASWRESPMDNCPELDRVLAAATRVSTRQGTVGEAAGVNSVTRVATAEEEEGQRVMIRTRTTNEGGVD